MLDKIHHVAITVADIEKSIRWYTTSFNCEVIQQEKTLAILEFANIKLTLILPSQQPPHLAFLRPDAAKFGELTEQIDGTYSTFLSDPTGNPIEIIAAGDGSD